MACGMSGVFVHQELKTYTGPRLPRAKGCTKPQSPRGAASSEALRSPTAAKSTSAGATKAGAGGRPQRASQPVHLTHCAARSCPQSAAGSRKSSKDAETAKTLRDVQAALLAVQKITTSSEAGHVDAGCRSDQLNAARAARKAQLAAVERSRAFADSIFLKLDDLRGSLASCSTSCGTDSPRELASPGCTPLTSGIYEAEQASPFCFDVEVSHDQRAGPACRLARAPAQAWLP